MLFFNNVIIFLPFAKVPGKLAWIKRNKIKSFDIIVNLSMQMLVNITGTVPKFHQIIQIFTEEFSKIFRNFY